MVRGQVGSGVDGAQAFGGLSGDDSIIGGGGADWIHAGAGDDYLYGGDGADTLYGGEGADTLDGGAGDDVLIGGPGADVYRFGWGSGQDLVYNNGWDDALDTVELGAGIKQADVALTRDLDDLLISLVEGSDSLRIKDHFNPIEMNASKVDRLRFAEDGTVWDLSNFDPTGSVSITGTAIQGQTLTVSNTLADLDGLGPISYQWNANGTAINGATGSAYTLTQAEVGKVITVVAGYVNGGGRSESVMSAPTATVGDATELSDLTGLVLTRKGQALPDFEAQLALSTLDQLDLALVQETVALDGSRTLRFALTVDSAAQAFGAFNLALRTEAGVEIVGLTLSDAFASWTSIPNPLSAQQLLVGAFSTNPDEASYLSGELALGELVVRMGADHTGPLRIAVEGLALGAAPVQSGVLRYESAGDLGAGLFAFLGLEDGQIDLSFVGSISNIGDSITAQDALEALRLAVRLPSDYSDAYGLISADYNQDGRVTSQDALEILKTSVRMPGAIQPKWVFLADEADLSAVNSRNTGYKDGLTLDSFSASASHNFTAVLLGDVNDSLVFV
ncbi:calcium-binding protein [Thauera mechernichensis]